MIKNNIFYLAIVLLGLALISCGDDSTTDPVSDDGTIYVESDPTGAEIWLDGVNTGVVTPGTIDASSGSHVVTLKSSGYGDVDINVALSAGQEYILTAGTTLSLLGTLIVDSEPEGATIWLDGENTGEVTPHSFSIGADNYTLTLQFTDYSDTTLVTQVTGGSTRTESINMTPEFIKVYTATIWETIGTSAEQPSGLDLSTGVASSIGAGSNSDVDIYYNSNGFLVMSANGRNEMTRETYFKVTDGTDLKDGVNSTAKDNSWTTDIADTEQEKNIFLYDADGHYSKFMIVSLEGGTPDNPAHLIVKWIYNERENSLEF